MNLKSVIKLLAFSSLSFALFTLSGCASLSRYTKGKVQKGASPQPSVTLLPLGPRLHGASPLFVSCGVNNLEPQVHEVSGTLMRFFPFKSPSQGFRLELKAKDRIWIVDVKVTTDILPKLEPHTALTVSLLTGYQTTFVIEDENGIVFYLWCGEETLLKETPLIKVEPSAVQAFIEVKSMGPCESTEIVTKVLVSDERNAVFVEPSQVFLFERENRQYAFVLLDSRFVDENQCGEINPPRVAFFIARVAPDKQIKR